MADAPINLNRARKARARVQKARKADENTVTFGRTRAERARESAQRDLDSNRLDAHRRESDPSDSAPDP